MPNPIEPAAIPVVDIEATAKTQARVRLDPTAIDEYAESMKNGDIFPPLDVFREMGSERIVLADGFHRLAASKKAGIPEILCNVRAGDVHDALRFAMSRNRDHGVRRTRADKSKAVDLALADPFFDGMTLRGIADHCGVGKDTVSRRKQELNEQKNDLEAPPPEDKPDNTPEGNTRKPKLPLTQGQLDREALLQACQVIRSMVYPGAEASEHMELTAEDIKIVADAGGWLLGACNG